MTTRVPYLFLAFTAKYFAKCPIHSIAFVDSDDRVNMRRESGDNKSLSNSASAFIINDNHIKQKKVGVGAQLLGNARDGVVQ